MPTPSERDVTRILTLLDNTKTVTLENHAHEMPVSMTVWEIGKRLRLAPARAQRLVRELVETNQIVLRGWKFSLVSGERSDETYSSATALEHAKQINSERGEQR